MTTMPFSRQLRELILQTYEHAETRLHEETDGRVFGTIISPSFVGIDEERRQEELYQLVKQTFGPDSTHKLLFVFMNTPEEDAIFERHRQAG